MTQQGPASRRGAAVAVGVIVVGIGLWLGLGRGIPDPLAPAPAAPDARPRTEAPASGGTGPTGPLSARPAGDASADASRATAEPVAIPRIPLPSYRVASGTPLRLTAAELPPGKPLAIALLLPDEARGNEPRPVRVVSADGRTLHATATPLPGKGSGMRVELEPHFLRPGRYMLEVKTAERAPLPLRRWVIEVQ